MQTALELKALIIEKQPELAAALSGLLLPEVMLIGFEIRQNLHKGIQSLKDNSADVCFISEVFEGADLQAFFSDIRALKKDDEVFFVQIREVLEEGFDRKSVEELGYGAVVSRKLTEGDKASLVASVKEFLHIREIKRKRIDVTTAVKLLLLELERVYKNKKRGVSSGFRRAMVADYMSDQMDFHSDVFMGYIEALDKHTETSQPGKAKTTVLNMPESMTSRDLPGIEDGAYVGVSLRVYDMLQEKFGNSDGASPPLPRVSEDDDDGETAESRAEKRLKGRLKNMGLEEE